MAAKLVGARQYPIVVFVCSLVALGSSLALIHAEITHLQSPNTLAACDINALFGCGSSITSPEAHLVFGLPNAVIGVMAFALLSLISLLIGAAVTLPRWLWWALSLGSLGALGWVGYFVYLSLTEFSSLCPYCTVVWAMTIAIAVFTLSYANARGYLPLVGLGTHVWNFRWLYTFALWVVVVIAVLIGLPSQVASLF